MRILDKYIAKIIIQKIILVLVILSSLFLVFNFLDQIEDVGQDNYNVFKVSLYTLMTLPLALQDVLAIIILIGIMLGLGQLINHHELIAMRSSGFSSACLIKHIIKIGIVVSFILLLFNELFAFSGYHFAQKYRQQALGKSIINSASTWLKYQQYFLLLKPYQTKNSHHTSLALIRINQSKISQIDMSQRIFYDANKINLVNVDQYKINKLGKIPNIYHQSLESQTLNFALPKTILDNINHQSDYLNTWALWQQVQYLSTNNIQNKKYLVDFYHRLSKPLLLISMIFIGLIFMLGNDRSLNIGRQVFFGIVLSFILHIFNRLISNTALAFGYNIALSVFLPVIVLFLVSAWLVWRRHKEI